MELTINTKEVFEQAKQSPLRLEKVSREDFHDQDMVIKNTRAIQAKGAEDTTIEALNTHAFNFTKEVYQRHITHWSAAGEPWVQWSVEQMLCEHYGIPFDHPKPPPNQPPADIAFTTAYLDRKAREVQWKEQMRAERLAASRSSVATGAATNLSFGGFGYHPKSATDNKTIPAQTTHVLNSTASVLLIDLGWPLLMIQIWRKWLLGAPDPIATAPPGMNPCGPFEFPFPLERDWNICYASVREDITKYIDPVVKITVHEHWDGKKLCLSLTEDADSSSARIQEEFVQTVRDVFVWHKEIRQGQDVPITDVMKRHFMDRARKLKAEVLDEVS